MLALYALPVALAAFAPALAGRRSSRRRRRRPCQPVRRADRLARTATERVVQPRAERDAEPRTVAHPGAEPGTVAQPGANPFGYVVSPSPPPAGAPRIIEIALNDKVLRPGGCCWCG